jgi:hypothetical protein
MLAGMDTGEQAAAAWAPLARDVIRWPRWWRPVTVVVEGPWMGAGRASVWALGQVMAAALDGLVAGVVERDAVERLLDALDPYRHGAGYTAVPGGNERYYDDNAWIGLDLFQAGGALVGDDLLDGARRVLGFLGGGMREGGVYWLEGGPPTRHTCSTGPTAELALRLALAGDAGARTVGEEARAFLERTLRGPDGLYADHVHDDGTIDRAVWSYNQGTPVGAAALWFRLTGDGTAVDAARASADAALAHFAAENRLWTQPPAFNAIFFRNLLLFDALAGYPAVAPALAGYLERVWTQARHPATGWFTEGGIGRYGNGGTLDQAGLAQLFALTAWPRDRWADVC